MSTDSKKKINYIGSVWHNEYEGEFAGYSLYLTSEDLKYAQKFLGETDRVQIKLRPGRDDPKKPYGSIETAKTAAPPKTEQPRVMPTTTLEF